MPAIKHRSLDLVFSGVKALLFPCFDTHTKCMPNFLIWIATAFHLILFLQCLSPLLTLMLPALLRAGTLQGALCHASLNPHSNAMKDILFIVGRIMAFPRCSFPNSQNCKDVTLYGKGELILHIELNLLTN